MRGIKQMVCSRHALKYYDITMPAIIQSHGTGLGCCLLQRGQPMAFASRALTQTDHNYTQIEKECLSIVFTCHRYLNGSEAVTAGKDNKPLITIFKKPLLSAPKRLQVLLQSQRCVHARVQNVCQLQFRQDYTMTSQACNMLCVSWIAPRLKAGPSTAPGC